MRIDQFSFLIRSSSHNSSSYPYQTRNRDGRWNDQNCLSKAMDIGETANDRRRQGIPQQVNRENTYRHRHGARAYRYNTDDHDIDRPRAEKEQELGNEKPHNIHW